MQKGMVNFAFALFAALMLLGSAFAIAAPGGNVPIAGNNIPPVITSVGGPTSLTAGQAGTWAVSAHDPDGTYLAYSVNWGEGNNMAAQAPITPGNTATFQHTYSSAGTYTITFTVTDASGATTQSTLTTVVTAPVSVNQPPVITNVAGPSSLTAGTSGTWSVSAYDPDGAYLTYSVNWGEGNSVAQQMPSQQQVGSTATFQHTYANAGTYTITFTVTDAQGAIKQTTTTVVVSAPVSVNQPPVITGATGPSSLTTGTSGTWTVSAYDPDGTYLTYGVTWGDGLDQKQAGQTQSGSTATFQHTYANAGTYTITFTATDSAGATTQSTITVNVGGAAVNQPPVFSYKDGPTTLQAGNMGFWRVAAWDPENTPISFIAYWGDGADTGWVAGTPTTPGNPNLGFYPNHTYSAPGAYTIKYIAKDSAGGTSSDTYAVTVTQLIGSNLPPVITGVAGPSSLNVGETGTFKLSAYDPENSPITISINWGDGSTAGNPVLNTTMAFQHAYASAGAYVITFTVGDEQGATVQSTLSVNVGSGITPTTQKIALNLKTGWNQVSVPTNYSVTPEQIAQKCDISTTVWAYNPETGQYTTATTLRYGMIGFWIKANSACTYELDAPYYSPETFPMRAGWNMIGSPLQSTAISSFIGDCKITSGPWNYSPSAGQYSQSSMLEPGKGYWVKVASACTLGANTPPGTPSG